jgi:hypothetical protein
MAHSLEQDFEHFLSYSGLSAESEDLRSKLLMAYEANWKASEELAEWRFTNKVDELERLVNAKQAEIDRLMLEFCPDEMTPEQLATCEASQRFVHMPVFPNDGKEPDWKTYESKEQESIHSSEIQFVTGYDPVGWTIIHNGRSVTAENISKCALLARKLRTPEEEAKANAALTNAFVQFNEELGQEELDAAAYRWLRRQHEVPNTDNYDMNRWTVFKPGQDMSLEPVECDPGELDRQIHAQIAKEENE